MEYYKPNIVDALNALGFSDVAGAVINTEAGYKDLKIYSEKPIPKWSDVSNKLKELEKQYADNQYQRDRAVAYDPIPEQLDQIYHDIDGWKAKIKAVKDKYPKP
tara:strand:- start:160 stop:471 length:312 start_codon:yes stop_codon:yes gene_type:complete